MGQLGIGGWFRIVYYKLWSEIESGVRPPGGGYICVEPGILGINHTHACSHTPHTAHTIPPQNDH